MSSVVGIAGDGTEINIPLRFGKYVFVEFIGSGSFSVVALVRDSNTNEEYACKICSRRVLTERGIFVRFEREVRVMQALRHPALVAVLDVWYDKDLIYLVMEHCKNGELFQVIAARGKMREDDAARMFKRLVEGVAYIHARDVAHRDIKPENILLDEHMNPKITDFGLCHAVNGNPLLSTPCGSLYYAPPEIISNQPYNGKKSDIWSLGVVLFTMVTGSLPWHETNQSLLFRQISDADFRIPGFVSPNLRDLIARLMRPDPDHRPLASEILKHPWFSEPRLPPRSSSGSLCSTVEEMLKDRGLSTQRVAGSSKRPQLASSSGLSKDLLRRVPCQGGRLRRQRYMAILTPPPAIVPPVSKSARDI
jgi:serine/threonine protein kinase